MLVIKLTTSQDVWSKVLIKIDWLRQTGRIHLFKKYCNY